MAFVSRNERDFNITSGLANVGPGSYENLIKINKNNNLVQNANSPFFSSDLREIDKKNKDHNPGPGDYKPQ